MVSTILLLFDDNLPPTFRLNKSALSVIVTLLARRAGNTNNGAITFGPASVATLARSPSLPTRIWYAL